MHVNWSDIKRVLELYMSNEYCSQMMSLYVDTSNPNNKMAVSNSIKICIYNCRSIKNCRPDIQLLLRDNHVIILLQKHWLLACYHMICIS